MGHIEADHRDRHAGPEDHVGGLGVGIDVELGRGRPCSPSPIEPPMIERWAIRSANSG